MTLYYQLACHRHPHRPVGTNRGAKRQAAPATKEGAQLMSPSSAQHSGATQAQNKALDCDPGTTHVTAIPDAPPHAPQLRTERHELFGIPVPQNPHEAEVVAHLARRTAKRKAKKATRIVLELGLILAICLAGQQVSDLLPFDMPSNICSMIILLVFLVSGVLRMDNISDGADFLLDHMSVFFIPAAVAIMGSFDLLAGNIVKLIVICLITTVLAFFVTSLTVSTVMNLMMRRDAKLANEAGMDGNAVAVANVVEMAAAIKAYARHRSEGENSEAALYKAEAEAKNDVAGDRENVKAWASASGSAPIDVDELTARLAAEANAEHDSKWHHPGKLASSLPSLRRAAAGGSVDASREAQERAAERDAVEKLKNAARAASSAQGRHGNVRARHGTEGATGTSARPSGPTGRAPGQPHAGPTSTHDPNVGTTSERNA